MAQEFKVKVLTPQKELVDAEVSEILLPAYDGEVGILGGHENFVGLLGTGVLKLVRQGNDYWFMISSGVFEVDRGNVTVLAEVGEDAKSVQASAADNEAKELETALAGKNLLDPEIQTKHIALARAKARLEAHRRTELLN